MSKATTKPRTGTASSPGLSSAVRNALHLLLLALIALAAYSNTLHAPFVFDDISSIVDNGVIKDLSRFFSEGRAFNPRRVVGYFTFALNYRVGGLDTFGYHVVNLGIHILSGWTVYFLVGVTLKTPFFSGEGREKLALLPLFVALLFIAHPVQTQAVTYIVQRLASLVALFYLLSLLLYVKGRLSLGTEQEQGSSAATGMLRPVLFFLGAVVFAVLAAQTKEIAATLPLIVLLYEFCFFKPSKKRNLILLVSLLLCALLAGAALVGAGKPLGDLLSDVNELSRETGSITRGAYLLTQFSVIATYLRLLLLPVRQNLDYDYPVYHSLFVPPVFFSLLLLLALIGAAAWLFYRSTPYGLKRPELPSAKLLQTAHHFRLIAFGIFWFFITLSIESSIIPIADVIFEHRLYLPSVGAFTALVAAALLLFKGSSPKAFAAGAAVVTVLFAVATWQRNQVWESQVRLWGDVVEKSPGKSRANDHYGVALSTAGRVEEAAGYLNKAVEINPRNWFALYNLGRMLDEMGNIDAAISCYQAAIGLNPELAVAHNNLAVDYLIKGDEEQAIRLYNVVLKLKPEFAEAHNNLGYVLKGRGKVDEAIGHFQAAIRSNGDYAKAYNNLGEAYQEKGELDQAISQFEEAVRLRPEDPVSRENLAKALNMRQARQ